MMIFSGSALVDREDASGLLRRPALPGGRLHGLHTGQADPEHRGEPRPRPHVHEVRRQPRARPRPARTSATPRSSGTRETQRFVMVAVLPDEHKVRFFGSRDLKRWETLSDFGPAGATGGVWECPDLFPLPVEGEPGVTRYVLDVDLNPGRRRGRLGRTIFRGHVRRDALHERQPAADDALGRLRQGLLRDALLLRPASRGRPPHLDGLDGQLALRQRGAHVALARAAVGAPRARPAPTARRPAPRAVSRSAELASLRTKPEPTPRGAQRAPCRGPPRSSSSWCAGRGAKPACASPTPPVRRWWWAWRRSRSGCSWTAGSSRRDAVPRGVPGPARGPAALARRPRDAARPLRPLDASRCSRTTARRSSPSASTPRGRSTASRSWAQDRR